MTWNKLHLSADTHPTRYSRLMGMIYMTILLAATTAAYRLVIIGPVPEPGSTLIYTFSFFLGNVFAEVYGYRQSRLLIWESIGCGYLFAILLTLINLLPAPDFWDKSDAYNQILGHVLRFTNAGVIGYLISAFLNAYLITQWKDKMRGRLFWLRSLLASSLSEGAATAITGVLSFVGMMPANKMGYLLASAFLFKLFYGLIAVWPASFLAYFLKQKENAALQCGISRRLA